MCKEQAQLREGRETFVGTRTLLEQQCALPNISECILEAGWTPNCVVMLWSWLQRFVCLNVAVCGVSMSAEFTALAQSPKSCTFRLTVMFDRLNNNTGQIQCPSRRSVGDSKNNF